MPAHYKTKLEFFERMNYDPVVPDDLEDEEMEATVVVSPPRTLDWKHKALYTCLGVFLTTKILVILWIFTLSFPSNALENLFHW